MVETILDAIFEEAITGIALGTGIAIIGYFRSILNRQKQNKSAIDSLCKRAWRIEKAVALMAIIITQETKKIHADADTADLEKLVKEIMKDK